MDDEAERTLYCGNLDSRVTEDILFELFIQAGPLQKVKLPEGKPYGFITFQHPVSVEYTIKLMDGIRLFNKSLRLQPRTGSSTPARQNSSGGNINMMQNGMMGNMNNLSPALMGHPGILGQSPFQRSYSAPQFQSTPNSHHQRFTEGSEQGGRGRNDSPDFRDRSNDRQQRERERINRDHSRDKDRDRSFDRDRDYSRDRDHSRDRDYGQNRDYGRDRNYGRDRGRDRSRDWDNNRDRSQDRGSNSGGLSRGDTFPLMQGQQQYHQLQQHHHQQGQLTRQSGFDQDPMALSIENELRRQRVLQQQEAQFQFRQQMQEAMKHNFGRQQHQGRGRRGWRH